MVATTVEPHKSSLGNLDANVMSLIAYVAAAVIGWIPVLRYFAWLAPLVIFFMEKNSGFVKFHAMQAFILNAIGQILAFLITVVLGGIVTAALYGGTSASVLAAAATAATLGLIVTIVSIVITIFAIIATYNSYMYKTYHIPVIGNLADKLSGKLSAK